MRRRSGRRNGRTVLPAHLELLDNRIGKLKLANNIFHQIGRCRVIGTALEIENFNFHGSKLL